jgi:integrase
VNRETEVLDRALRLAFERHKLAAIPRLRHRSERNARQGFFESGEFEAVVAALPEPLKDLARFAFLTGWRRGEIIGLRWANVDRDGGVIRPGDSKNGRGRVLALDGDLRALVERRVKARALVTDLVFHVGGEPIVDFRKSWASACKAAGVAGRLFHDLGRTAIRNMVRAGVREGVAMAISGHRTRSVFDRYNIVNEADLRDAMKKTSAYNAQPKRSNVRALKAVAT